MRRIAFLLAIAALCFSQQSSAFWQSRDSNYNKNVTAGGGGGYAGAGDVVSGAYAWWGLRAYNAAYATGLNKIANICTPADAVCADVNSDASGNFNLSGTGSLVCNNVGSICTVKTLYDQSGASSCSGPCDLANATPGSRPTLLINCVGSLPCMSFLAASNQTVSKLSAVSSLAQPYTFSFVSERTANFSVNNTVFDSNGQTVWSFYGSSGNVMRMTTNVSAFGDATASDGAPHSFQQVYSGSSSSDLVDATANTGLPAGIASISTSIALGKTTGGGSPMTGYIMEFGIWASAVSGGNQTSLATNQHAYWGF